LVPEEVVDGTSLTASLFTSWMRGVQVVIREWRGRASLSRAEAYPRHFRDKVVPELRRVPGFVGAHLSQRRFDDTVEFLVLTRWRSMDSVRAFAGPNIEKAVVEPGAVAVLIEFDAEVRHYDVIEKVPLP
jgi:heme-degrading monooxygenase HmoA